MISKYGKPVDRTEWDMEPQTYNAYYNPSNNEICVPDAILLFQGMNVHLPTMHCCIPHGATFGHEITHGLTIRKQVR